MKLGSIFAALVAAVLCTYGVISVVKYQKLPLVAPPTLPATEANKPKDVDDPPEIAAHGPYPIAECESPKFDFGSMGVGSSLSHKFTIKNAGAAPLRLTKGKTTCKCTLSNIAQGQIEPGASAVVELTWKPIARTEAFRQSATIHTNDPEHKTLELEVVGKVEALVMLYPETNWGAEVEDQPTKITAAVYSKLLDHFEVKVETSSDSLKFDVEPMPEEDKAQFEAKCGHKLVMHVSPNMPVGSFSLPLVIKTDVHSRTAEGDEGTIIEFEMSVNGRHHGPVQIYGQTWNAERMAVGLGTFEAGKGSSTTLFMFVKNDPPEGLKFTEITAEPSQLKVRLVPEESGAGGKKRYRLEFECAPGPPASHLFEEPGKIQVKTNHPGLPEMYFLVHYVSY